MHIPLSFRIALPSAYRSTTGLKYECSPAYTVQKRIHIRHPIRLRSMRCIAERCRSLLCLAN